MSLVNGYDTNEISGKEELRSATIQRRGTRDFLDVSFSEIDLVNNPKHEWEVTNPDGQPESETVTLANGDVYKRTFTYSTVSGMRILTERTAWQKQ